LQDKEGGESRKNRAGRRTLPATQCVVWCVCVVRVCCACGVCVCVYCACVLRGDEENDQERDQRRSETKVARAGGDGEEVNG
jgi:hypothetical protein